MQVGNLHLYLKCHSSTGENGLKNIYLEADLELTYHVDLKWGRKVRFANIIVVFKHKFQHLEEYLEKLVAMLLFFHSQTVQL